MGDITRKTEVWRTANKSWSKIAKQKLRDERLKSTSTSLVAPSTQKSLWFTAIHSSLQAITHQVLRPPRVANTWTQAMLSCSQHAFKMAMPWRTIIATSKSLIESLLSLVEGTERRWVRNARSFQWHREALIMSQACQFLQRTFLSSRHLPSHTVQEKGEREVAKAKTETLWFLKAKIRIVQPNKAT